MASFFLDIFRVIVQLALSAGVIAFTPGIVIVCLKLFKVVFERDWSEAAIGLLGPLGLFGVLALCVSIFASTATIANREGLKKFVVYGLLSGLLVSAVLFVRFLQQSASFPKDWISFYVTIGPAIVAIWNLTRIRKTLNQIITAQRASRVADLNR